MQRGYVGIRAYCQSRKGRFKASDKLRIERAAVFFRSGLELFVKRPRQPVLRTMGVIHSVLFDTSRALAYSDSKSLYSDYAAKGERMGESVRSQYRIPKELNDWLSARARSKNAPKTPNRSSNLGHA